MLLIRNLLNALFVLSFVACSANEQQKNYRNNIKITADVISIGDAGGDRAYFAVMFSDSNALERALQENQIDDFRGFVEMNMDSRIRISKSALLYLQDYVTEHCNQLPVDTNKVIFGTYEIRLISNFNVEKCLLYNVDREVVLRYFEGMKSWIEKSEYKNEFKDLLRYLDWRIEYVKEQMTKIKR